MTKIIANEDCGNSPKNIFVQSVTIAFVKGDTQFLLNSVTEDIRWNIVGGKVIEGKAAFAKALEQRAKHKALELSVGHVLTHGKAGAVNGVLKFKGGVSQSFCDVYEFNGAKGTSIKEITSYVIETK
jgi:hypothetical protein